MEESRFIDAAARLHTRLLQWIKDISAVDTKEADRASQGLQELQHALEAYESQRVLVLDSWQLMDSGIDVYNAARKAFINLPHVSESDLGHHIRFQLARARYIAARIMHLSLSCSTADKAHDQTRHKQLNANYLNQCIDVLRSFARVGAVLLELASHDPNRSDEYLSLAQDVFERVQSIWSGIGLAHLARYKVGMELEEVLSDLWTCWMDRIRVNQLVASRQEQVLDSVRELQTLLPYLPAYTNDFLEMTKRVSDSYKQQRDDKSLAVFTEEVLRTYELLEGDISFTSDSDTHATKQHIVLNYLETLIKVKDVERAEACFALLPNSNDAKALAALVAVYVHTELYDKARRTLVALFELGNLQESFKGVRMYVQACHYSDKALEIYQELHKYHGAKSLEVSVEMACNLVDAEGREKRRVARKELERVATFICDTKSEGEHSVLLDKVFHTILDAARRCFNENATEECLEWAKTGYDLARNDELASIYQRVLALTHMRLGHQEQALQYATQAHACQKSKPSLYCLFQVTFHSDHPNVDELHNILNQLQSRDDFQIKDLVVFVKAATEMQTTADRSFLLKLMDDLCSHLKDGKAAKENLPVEYILQDTAQLAYNSILHSNTDQKSDSTSTNTFATAFRRYAHILVELSTESPPPSDQFTDFAAIYQWFYATSFMVGKTTEDASFFILAADIAHLAFIRLGDRSPLLDREAQSLLAAISSWMSRFEELDQTQLRSILTLVSRYEQLVKSDRMADDVKEYLTKSHVACQVRLLEAEPDELFQLCQSRLRPDVKIYEQLAGTSLLYHAVYTDQVLISFLPLELVLYAIKFEEAFHAQAKYRKLASDLFRHALQLSLQHDYVSSERVSYLFRRLIDLAESKASAYEWFQQLVQLSDSIALDLTEADTEWFVGRAWNMGVRCHRSEETPDAKRFLSMALSILDKHAQLSSRMKADMQQQYHHFISSRQ